MRGGPFNRDRWPVRTDVRWWQDALAGVLFLAGSLTAIAIVGGVIVGIAYLVARIRGVPF